MRIYPRMYLLREAQVWLGLDNNNLSFLSLLCKECARRLCRFSLGGYCPTLPTEMRTSPVDKLLQSLARAHCLIGFLVKKERCLQNERH